MIMKAMGVSASSVREHYLGEHPVQALHHYMRSLGQTWKQCSWWQLSEFQLQWVTWCD